MKFDAGVRAMVAQNLKPHYEKQAKERLKTSTGGSNPQPVEKIPQAETTKSRDAAGKAAGVNGRSTSQARAWE